MTLAIVLLAAGKGTRMNSKKQKILTILVNFFIMICSFLNKKCSLLLNLSKKTKKERVKRVEQREIRRLKNENESERK